jgi:hypothetical protein
MQRDAGHSTLAGLFLKPQECTRCVALVPVFRVDEDLVNVGHLKATLNKGSNSADSRRIAHASGI